MSGYSTEFKGLFIALLIIVICLIITRWEDKQKRKQMREDSKLLNIHRGKTGPINNPEKDWLAIDLLEPPNKKLISFSAKIKYYSKNGAYVGSRNTHTDFRNILKIQKFISAKINSKPLTGSTSYEVEITEAEFVKNTT